MTSGTSASLQPGLTAGSENNRPDANESVSFSVEGGEANNITIGSTDPESGYKYQIELSPKGACYKKSHFQRIR